jgi:glycerate 2-kinase
MPLRDDALACFAAAIRAVEPEGLVAAFLAGHPELAAASGKIWLAGIGKAAAAMARGARRALGERLAGGVLIVPAGGEGEAPAGFEVHGGGHPAPTAAGMAGADAIRRLAAAAGEGDLLLALISGGGSALMTLPPAGVSLAAVGETTGALLRAGASIGELNCVRKHLDRLKGGRLAREARPARVLALVLSDVVGDPLDVIASGPVSPDPTTFADAVEVLERRGVWAGAPAAVREHLEAGRRGEVPESPKPGDPCFTAVEVHVVGSNRMAAAAAREEAARRGYGTLLLSTRVTGEAREVGRVLAAIGSEVAASGNPLPPPACLLAAGETTVTVTGGGRGGRNQEVALGAALALAGTRGVLVAAAGTDGIDGPTDAAGAVADGDTVARALGAGLEPEQALADNDAYPLFAALGDLITTGHTGTNVMDLYLVLVGAGT